jgi:hypothetical protein
MFGFGNKAQRRVRNDTFGPNKLRNAAIAGVGMLAWQWWRNRQATSRPSSGRNRFNENTDWSTTGSPQAADRF